MASGLRRRGAGWGRRGGDLWPSLQEDQPAPTQIGDKIDYQGRDERLYSQPLEDYRDLHPPRPRLRMRSTACKRGYVASWRIADGKLWLLDIGSGDEEPEALAISLQSLFPGETGPVHATWYTGVLRIPQGKRIAWGDGEFLARFESDVMIST